MIRKKVPDQKLIVDLDGPCGNAYYLLSLASEFADELDLDKVAIRNEMEAGDYNNLITVFEKYFGDYVILEREKDD